jgi:UDP-N-acetylglucosamine--N-acetylmuramyl-(pentapeptide) pyrophosphoryl-undecaprenol N-acetylglucosamine transferase
MNEVKTYRFIISGGGTGGHVFPALAVANELRLQFGNPEILFVGAKGKMEMTKVPENGYKIIGLNIRGLQRSLSFSNLLFPFRLISSLFKARSIIKEFRPDVAIGFGGYASAPVLWVAAQMGVPTIIQEQNSYAGIANKILGKKAFKICVAYEEMDKYFSKDKIVLTGNPVRKEIMNLENKKSEAISYFELDPSRKTLLVLGGSLGARSINESIIGNLQTLAESGIQMIWQTGQIYYEEMISRSARINFPEIRIHKFLDRIDLAYSAADVVIARAGALTIAELCVAGKASILVPSPNVAEDHQTRNANYLAARDAALMIPDKEAVRKLVRQALELLNNTDKQEQLKTNSSAMAKTDAAREIVEQLKIVLK